MTLMTKIIFLLLALLTDDWFTNRAFEKNLLLLLSSFSESVYTEIHSTNKFDFKVLSTEINFLLTLICI